MRYREEQEEMETEEREAPEKTIKMDNALPAGRALVHIEIWSPDITRLRAKSDAKTAQDFNANGWVKVRSRLLADPFYIVRDFRVKIKKQDHNLFIYSLKKIKSIKTMEITMIKILKEAAQILTGE